MNSSQQATDNSRIELDLISPKVGALVRNIDLSAPLDAFVVDALREHLGRHGVLFFEDQHISPDNHVDLARRFGAINVNRFFKSVEGHESVAEVRKEPDQTKNIGALWHTDHSYDIAPAMGSILYALEVPPAGGDTLFANLSAAFASLSPALQRKLRSLNAWHSSRHVFGQAANGLESRVDGRIGNAAEANQDACHPMVISHPLSKLPTLYVNPQFTVRIDGWTEPESQAFLQGLWDHVVKEEHCCRFRWNTGSVAFWDNRMTWHKALNDYHGYRRLMHRVTVDGVLLKAHG